MRNLLYKIDISSLSWCSSVFRFLLYFCFCVSFLVPSASKILRDLRVKFFTVTVTVFSKKHHTGSNLLQFVIPDILLPLFIRTSTINLFFFRFLGFTNFCFAFIEQFLFFCFFLFLYLCDYFACFMQFWRYVCTCKEAIRKLNKENSKGNWNQMIKESVVSFKICKFIFLFVVVALF